jgi:hypothetical protein
MYLLLSLSCCAAWSSPSQPDVERCVLERLIIKDIAGLCCGWFFRLSLTVKWPWSCAAEIIEALGSCPPPTSENSMPVVERRSSALYPMGAGPLRILEGLGELPKILHVCGSLLPKGSIGFLACSTPTLDASLSLAKRARPTTVDLEPSAVLC